MAKKNGKVLKLKKIKKKINTQQNNTLVNKLNNFEKEKKKFEQEKFEH